MTLQRGHARRQTPVTFYRRARPGRRVRDRRRHASRSRRSARATAGTCSTCCLPRHLPGQVQEPEDVLQGRGPVAADVQLVLHRQQDIAVFTSGRLPIRPRDVDPGLLTDGNGDYEWTGFLRPAARTATTRTNGRSSTGTTTSPRASAPPTTSGRAGSAARRPAQQEHRPRSPERQATLRSLTAAMNAAATQDVRAVNTMPLLTRLLGGRRAQPRAQQMLDRWSPGRAAAAASTWTSTARSTIRARR